MKLPITGIEVEIVKIEIDLTRLVYLEQRETELCRIEDGGLDVYGNCRDEDDESYADMLDRVEREVHDEYNRANRGKGVPKI